MAKSRGPFFTTFSSDKLVALDAKTGSLLKEIPLSPLLAGPGTEHPEPHRSCGILA